MADDPLDLVGDVLGDHFCVDSVAGEGGLSVVYRGHHVQVGSPVAIKCLALPQTLDTDFSRPIVESFLEGSRLHYELGRGSLTIAQTLASGSTLAPRTGATVPYMVREWFEGESLARMLAGRRAELAAGKALPRRSLADAIRLLEHVAEGLAYAHGRAVVHHALRPSNVFLAVSEGVTRSKILDFGVGRAVDQASETLAPRARVLEPAYAAPEQLVRTLGDPGPQADVYTLALLVLEVLADRPVVDEPDVPKAVLKVLDPAARPSAKAMGLDLPEDVARVLERALSLEPTRRPSDAGSFWAALVEAAAREGTLVLRPALENPKRARGRLVTQKLRALGRKSRADVPAARADAERLVVPEGFSLPPPPQPSVTGGVFGDSTDDLDLDWDAVITAPEKAEPPKIPAKKPVAAAPPRPAVTTAEAPRAPRPPSPTEVAPEAALADLADDASHATSLLPPPFFSAAETEAPAPSPTPAPAPIAAPAPALAPPEAARAPETAPSPAAEARVATAPAEAQTRDGSTPEAPRVETDDASTTRVSRADLDAALRAAPKPAQSPSRPEEAAVAAPAAPKPPPLPPRPAERPLEREGLVLRRSSAPPPFARRSSSRPPASLRRAPVKPQAEASPAKRNELPTVPAPSPLDALERSSSAPKIPAARLPSFDGLPAQSLPEAAQALPGSGKAAPPSGHDAGASGQAEAEPARPAGSPALPAVATGRARAAEEPILPKSPHDDETAKVAANAREKAAALSLANDDARALAEEIRRQAEASARDGEGDTSASAAAPSKPSDDSTSALSSSERPKAKRSGLFGPMALGAFASAAVGLLVVAFILGVGRKGPSTTDPKPHPATPGRTEPSAAPEPALTLQPMPSAAAPEPTTSSSAGAPAQAHFKPRAAKAAIDRVAKEVASCRGEKKGLWGTGGATLKFGHDGKVSEVTLGPPYRNTPEGACVIEVLRQADMGAFEGPSVAVSYEFFIPFVVPRP